MKAEHYVGGMFRSDGPAFPLIAPADGTELGTVPEATREVVDDAVAAARSALKGPWGATSAEERAAALRRVADGIQARFEEFVDAEVADTGRPRAFAETVDVPRAVGNFRAYADLLYGRPERAYTTRVPGWSSGTGEALNYTVRRPLGVVAVVSPWNLPLLLSTWKIAPALACGNAVVAKPSEETPSTATLLARVIDEAGLPAGVFNVVHGHGPGAAGEFLTGHPGVDAIAFTGESATGAAIMRNAADHVTPVSFELGGKNPALVFSDADLEAAVDGTVRSSFTHSGQICLCTERVYVERPVFEEFVARLGERARALDGYGPMISAGHRDKVLSHLRLAREEGAEIVAGGGAPRFGDARDGGFHVEPTVLTGLPETARAVREEIFGPVCHVAPFDTEDEALALANDSRYGLAATVWTRDLSRAHRVAPRVETGIVWVNCWNLRDLRTPFGGVKASGIGREGGEYSLDFFSEPVNVCVQI
ncbi:aminomuconate-semialdehyde/2-hydroxymuconate-6-semialdehyde dehydrogenase [Actinomadura coerulea]|uniref:Aminomuconate-semialdehyde/2-hydroxymuconate-6-semialdehyde dehydrogenase n=1 Tax=Actinomadura coerulea TaxID=46159 RepID=A0A7X0FVB5_9ACTN|nr:2-hydroxymuconic semialdehyde dehydrogenase [Actinomadura coerulea]MBB6394388.1 aminomuconate-semialdehyde/2-hydroxymuconate-6-semialdehyde dehydrogenase [Actinomadura coerulea]GGQ40899.1 2-hydroxymuconic semialdehyde dehydrogenase [Actinomadura coerulea]